MDVGLLGCIIIGAVTPFCGFSMLKNGEFSFNSLLVVTGLCWAWMFIVKVVGI